MLKEEPRKQEKTKKNREQTTYATFSGKYAVTSLWLLCAASLFVLRKTSFSRPNQFAPFARLSALFTASKIVPVNTST